mgnify:CR=1 FL=1
MRGTLIGVPRVRYRAKIPAPAGQWQAGQRKYRYRVTESICFFIFWVVSDFISKRFKIIALRLAKSIRLIR